jgi:CheY-like chemotaxis protein
MVAAMARKMHPDDMQDAGQPATAPRQGEERMKKTAPLQADEHQSLLHSLRQALAAIESVAPGEEADARERADILGRAYQEALYAANRIGSLWVSARFDAGEFDASPTAVPVKELLAECVEQVRTRAVAAGVSIEMKAEGQETVHGDPALLKSMLTNLLAGTIGVSNQGTHLLLSSFRRADEILVKLEDQGDGITSRLFPVLVQSKAGGGRSDAQDRPVDIGTLTTKPIIDAHGGRLWVERQGESGGALFIALPTGPAPAPATTVASEGKKVLIVDDDPDGTFMLEQVLAKGGFEAVTATDGLSGLSKARSADIGLVLLDVMLPGMDGFEVCRRLRSDPATADLPILMISAKSRPEDRETGLRMGADGYMTKPLRLAEVLEKTSELMKKPRQKSS